MKVNISLASSILGFSRQAYYKPRSTSELGTEHLEDQLKFWVAKGREICPGQGCRSIYYDYADKLSIGRDKAELIMGNLGLNIRKPSKYVRTTESGKRLFDNLLTERVLTGLNQVWQGDMTYYIHGPNTFYIILITDVYSQYIVGAGAYDRAFACYFEEVLLQAINERLIAGYQLDDLIHHSDGGKQYEAKDYRGLCERHGIRQSMGRYSWENPYAEKTNDLIKNRYLTYWKPSSLTELRKCLKQAVKNHNSFQTKEVLNNLAPLDFEKTCFKNDQAYSPYQLELRPTQPMTKNVS